MPLSNWICTNNSKTMLLRIVHPGGHVELHDRPVTAAEIMCRSPRCCVAYPYVFQQPWAIVSPDTVLMLGQKFYVVPISTVRKLQMLSPRTSTPASEITVSPSVDEIRYLQSGKLEEDDGMISTCCILRKKSIAKQSNNCDQRCKNESEQLEIRADVRNVSHNVNDKNGGLSNDNWFVSLFNGVTTKANVRDITKETRTSSSRTELCDNNTLARKRNKDLTGNGLRGSPKKLLSFENWQPSLESITEE